MAGPPKANAFDASGGLFVALNENEEPDQIKTKNPIVSLTYVDTKILFFFLN